MIGQTVKVRLREPFDGRKNVTGQLLESGAEALRIRLEDGAELELPRALVGRSNVVWSPVSR